MLVCGYNVRSYKVSELSSLKDPMIVVWLERVLTFTLRETSMNSQWKVRK